MFTSAYKLMAVCLVAVFSMVMYGCSTSSKTDTATVPPVVMPEGPTDADKIAAAQTRADAAATAARMKATEAAALPQADDPATKAQIVEAEAAARAAEAAEAEADAATTVEAAEAAATAAETAKENAQTAYMMAMTASDMAVAAVAEAAAAAEAAAKVMAAQTRADTATTAARKSATDAAALAEADDPATKAQIDAAEAAATEAEDAKAMADAADVTAEDAEAAAMAAETAQGAAQTAYMMAKDASAMAVAAAAAAVEAAEAEAAAKVAEARTRAATAATAARKSATDAAALTNADDPDTAAAIAAAEAAARVAEAAEATANVATTVEAAEEAAKVAEDALETANTAYMMAMAASDPAVIDEKLEAKLADIKTRATTAATAARTKATDAAGLANADDPDTKVQIDAAEAAAEAAEAAEADAAAAATVEAAEAAATAAETALANAQTAYEMAMTASDVATVAAELAANIGAAQTRATTAAKAARIAADLTAELPEADDPDTKAQIEAAETAATAAETALAEANAATTVDEAEAAATAAETARGNADTAYIVAKAASNVAVATAEVKAAEARVVRATNAAGTKKDAIDAEGIQTVDAGLGGTGAVGYNPIDISHKDGAVSISVSTGADEDKVEFIKKMDLTGKHKSAGIMNVLGPNDDGETEIAIVYTDIKAPTDIPFVMADGKGRYMLTTNEKTLGGQDYQSISISMDNAVLASADLFSTPTGSGSVTLVGEDDLETEDVKENEFRGTFDDAMGKFTCTTDDGCKATITRGKLTNAPTLIFTPDKDVTVSEPDSEFLHYGVWLKKTDDNDGTTYDEVETFAGVGMGLGGATSVTTIEGSANYKGGAAGVYVRNVYLPSTEGEQEIDKATSGDFTAAVDLLANFGGGSVAEDDWATITGNIDNFSLSGGEDASGWGVKVVAEFGADGVTTVGDDIANSANGGGADDGSFFATFYGNDIKVVGGGNVRIGPKVLVGEFNAEFTNGSVAGGFGARRQ